MSEAVQVSADDLIEALKEAYDLGARNEASASWRGGGLPDATDATDEIYQRLIKQA